MMATPCRKIGCAALVHSRYKGGYCEAHQSERTGWKRSQAAKGNTTQRGYGHSWRKLRVEVLERDGYLCVTCEANGFIEPATDVDHIVSKAHGGSDELDNLQSLCRACHKDKTRVESSNGYFMPEWLRPIPQAVIVFGPPASGKTTWASNNTPNSVIVDLDVIIQELTGKPKHIKTEEEMRQGIDKRNQMLLNLANNGKPCTIILTGSTVQQRNWWVNKLQPKQVIQLKERESVLIDRIYADKNRPEQVRDLHLGVINTYEYE